MKNKINNTIIFLLFLWMGIFLVSCSGLSIAPNHYGKFIFEGKVTDEAGKPLSDVWVKIKGWETLTKNDGRWRQERVIECGATKEHAMVWYEADTILVIPQEDSELAQRVQAAEEKITIKHPAWFGSCEPEQVFRFDTVLKNKVAKINADQNPKDEIQSDVKKNKSTRPLTNQNYL